MGKNIPSTALYTIFMGKFIANFYEELLNDYGFYLQESNGSVK